MWQGLHADHRALVLQLVRYGVVGVGVTLFQTAIFNLLLGAGHQRPAVAITLATGLAMALGYTIHSRFTFQGHGSRDSAARTSVRFVAANMIGFAVNSLWLWLIATILHLSPHWTSVPMFFATPVLLFWLNRKWVFD
jgi:putative flippase GtrA